MTPNSKEDINIEDINNSEITESSEKNDSYIISEKDLSLVSIEDLIIEITTISEKDNVLSVSKLAEEVKSFFYIKLKQIQGDLEEGNIIEKETAHHPYEIEFKKHLNIFKRKKAKMRRKRENQEKNNLEQKRNIIDDIYSLTKEEESIKKTFEQFRILQEKWRSIGHVPIIESNNIWQTYHHCVEVFYDYIRINKDLRDLDFKRNFEEKTKICKKTEELINERSLNSIHQKLQELHEHWKNIGPVEKSQRDKIWNRFHDATKKLHKKRNDYFLLKKNESKLNLEKKNQICELIDNLTTKLPNTQKQWENILIESQTLEKKWKKIGKLTKKDNSNAWNKFKNSLNNIHQKKNNFYKDRKQNINNVLIEKTSICEKAELLSKNKDWKGTSIKLIRLQEKWKNAGFSPKKPTDKLWSRFSDACDAFFNAKKEYLKTKEEENKNNLKLKQSIIKELKKFKPSSDSKKDIKTLSEFSKEWKVSGSVPKDIQKIEKEFYTLLNNNFDALELDKVQLEREKFICKITSINGNKAKIEKEKNLIKSKIDNTKKDIIQYNTNISFFGKNKKNESLRKQVNDKIKSSEKKIKILIDKLKIINTN